MERFILSLTLVLAMSFIVLGIGPRASKETLADMAIFTPADVQWKDGPPSLPPGARFAVLEGDPSKAGLFTMRILLPDGYQIPPHWHTQVEHVTVLSGTFNLGMGDKFDQGTTKPMPAGTFGFWPPEMRHYAWTKGETVLQVHGMGPWTITYVNPSDDPRKPKG